MDEGKSPLEGLLSIVRLYRGCRIDEIIPVFCCGKIYLMSVELLVR